MNRRIIIWASAALIVVALLAFMKPGLLGFRPQITAGAAVLLDMESGEIWMENHADKPMPPASVSKLMIELLVFEQISSGELSWNEQIPVSKHASGMGGITLSLKPGDSCSVRELFEGISVYSANDAAVALAEYMAGTEQAFVQLMNEKAHDLGLSSDTVFMNATGLSAKDLGLGEESAEPTAETRMTARDMAKLAAVLITEYPEVLQTSSRTQMHLKGKGLYLSNTNLMLPAMGGAYAYDGADGLKTGYDSLTGYNIVGTAERDGRRLVAVVLGADSYKSRFEGTAKLFDYGFNRGLRSGERVKSIVQALSSFMVSDEASYR